MNLSNSRFALTLLAAALTMSLASCGNKDDKKVATQVAAKVGSEEISVHQINQILSRTNTAGSSPQAAQTMSRDVLEKLIDQQLAVEQAIENKLHRSPDVVSQIEAARRDILARAYLQQFAGALPKPKNLLRSDLPLPELAEVDVVRHYTKLSKFNYSVDDGFYPLGSCTMKYNPKINEDTCRLPGDTALRRPCGHP